MKQKLAGSLVKKIMKINRTYFLLWVVSAILLCTGCQFEKERNNLKVSYSDSKDSRYFNFGIIKKPVNLTICIPSSKEQRFLIIENPHINKIVITDLTTKEKKVYGDFFPFYSRGVEFRQFLLPVSPSEEDNKLIIEFDKLYENLSFGLHLLDIESFNHYQKLDNLIIGILFGVYFLAILIAIIIVLRVRTLQPIIFLLYLFFSFFWIINESGYFFQYLWPDNPWFHALSRGLFSTFSIIFFTYYVFLNNNIKINKIFKNVFIIILLFLIMKIIFSFLFYIEVIEFKYKIYYLSANAIFLILIFGYISFYLIYSLFLNKNYFFELISILIYCLFVIKLALSQLGIDLFQLPFFLQLESLIFINFQLLFMIIHISNLEANKKLQAVQEFLNFRMEQEKFVKQKILEVEDWERTRIGQNIHDEIGNIFTSLKYQFLFLKEKYYDKIENREFDAIQNILNEGVKNQTSILEDLLSNFEKGESLKDSLLNKLDYFKVNKDFQCDIDFLLSEKILTPFQKSQLYRIFSELFTNSAKHGNVTSISISISETFPIQVVYKDNGSQKITDTPSNGKGLDTIRFRIEQLKGEIIELRISEGFLLVFQIPLSHG